MIRLAYLAAAGLGAAAAALGLAGLAGDGWRIAIPWLVPLGGLELAMDRLAGFFLALIGLTTVPVSVYAIGYAGEDRRGAIAYLTFVAAMGVVPLAANVMTFLIAWELMALASYALVVQDAAGTTPGPNGVGHHVTPRTSRDAANAGWAYAVMAHAGLACLLAGMLVLAASTASARFADWPGGSLSPAAQQLAFALLALGFASKAGVIPLHVWLPLAHPAAPSHVSALMSGVMIKLGVYGLFRVTLDWLGPAPAWWGVAIVLAGAVSAVLGVLYALVEQDLKRLLAFSSIENVGIILIGLGAGLLFHGAGLAGLAALGLAAALYHTANHAAFKALLFLSAGAVVRATGVRDIEAMGGLARRMPWTAAGFLLGAVAISALPPLNGFVSEWLTFQALLQSPRIPHTGLGLVLVAGLAGLALTSGLAMACFVRAYGITFLALPRTDAAAAAREAPGAMRVGMAGAAAACIVLGLAPTVVLPALAAVAGELTGQATALHVGDWLTLDIPGDIGRLSTFTLTAGLALAAVVPVAVLRLLGRTRGRVFETWGCGRVLQTARMEYTATAFASPFRRIFDFMYRPVQEFHEEAHPDSRFFVDVARYAHRTSALAEDWLYRPVARTLQTITDRARATQSGSANVYLAYILAALLACLVLG